jgi:hypothetical protein
MSTRSRRPNDKIQIPAAHENDTYGEDSAGDFRDILTEK